MTRKDRIQWMILAVLLIFLVVIFIWNALQPESGPSGRIPVIDEVVRRRGL